VPPNGTLGTDGEPLTAAPVWSAAWTPDGDTLLLGAADGDLVEPTGGYLVLVDTQTWDIREETIELGSAQSMQLSPDEQLIAVASASDDVVVFLDATTLEVVREIPLAPDDRGTNMSFSPDGRLLAVGATSGAVTVIDIEAWEPVAGPTVVHDGVLLQVEWLEDGRTVVTSGEDGTVSLFDVERGLVRGRPLPASADAGEGATFLAPAPTDELVVLSGDRAGRRYPLEPSAWLEEACAVAGRDLTRAEWDRYLPERDYEPTCTDLP
jgi:WD40 repeat protein